MQKTWLICVLICAYVPFVFSGEILEYKSSTGCSAEANFLECSKFTNKEKVRIFWCYNSSEALLTLEVNLTDPDNQPSTRFQIEVARANEKIKRFLTVGPLNRTNEDYTIHQTFVFDHIYNNDYTVKVTKCKENAGSIYPFCNTRYIECGNKNIKNRISITNSIFRELEAEKMNISIGVTPMKNKGGIQVEIGVYNTTIVKPEFKEYFLEIFPTLTQTHFCGFRVPANTSIVHVRNCSDTNESTLNRETASCCHLTNDNFTFQVTPIDSRCNLRDVMQNNVNDYAMLQATRHSDTYICSRHVVFDLGQILPSSNWDIYELPSEIPVWPIEIITTIKFGPFQITLPESNHYNELMPLKSSPASRVLLVYELNDIQRERASSLRNQLLAEGVAKVYDYGDHDQEEEVIIEGIQNWFTTRIHDPDVRIIVILPPGTQYQGMSILPVDGSAILLRYIMDQLTTDEVLHSGNKYD